MESEFKDAGRDIWTQILKQPTSDDGNREETTTYSPKFTKGLSTGESNILLK